MILALLDALCPVQGHRESALVAYLALQNSVEVWATPIRDWTPAHNRFATEFEGGFPT